MERPAALITCWVTYADVGPDHQELTVRHVDHAHLAEREREPERSQQQDGAGRGTRQEGGGEYVHRSAFGIVVERRAIGRGCRADARHPRRTHGIQDPGRQSAFGSHQRVALEERIGLDRAVGAPHDVELVVGVDLADQAGLGDVVVLTVDRDRALRAPRTSRRRMPRSRRRRRTTPPSRPCSCRGRARCTPLPSGPTSVGPLRTWPGRPR